MNGKSSVERYVLLPEEEYKRLDTTQQISKVVPNDIPKVIENDVVQHDDQNIEYGIENQTKFVPISELKEEILKSVAVSYRHKVLTLFQFFKENPSFLKMSMMGEAVIEGKRIPSSSVHQLLHVLFHNRRKVTTSPLGIETFMDALAKSKFPIEHIVNQKLKSVLKSLRNEEKVYKDNDVSEDELKALIKLLTE